ncbi:MAG: DNA modification methylase [Bryobacteraceae bacterium]
MPSRIPPEDQSTPIDRPLPPASSERSPMPSPLVIELWAVERLSPYQCPLRKNDHVVDRMIASFREYGFKIPLLVSQDATLIDGHLRLKAAQKLGFTAVPVIVCDDWTPEKIRAFRLIANRSATWAEWDLDAVARELAELNLQGFDLSLTGFDPKEIDELLVLRPDEQSLAVIPALPGLPVSAHGDLWVCGDHRVLCGDATEPENVTRLYASVAPVIMVTDPPYGVGYVPGWRERAGLGKIRQVGLVENDDRVDWSEAFQLFRGDVAYVWHAGLYAGEVAASLRQCGFEIRSQLIWAKQHFALSRGNYHWQHEPCWYAVRRGQTAHWCGGRRQSTLWEVSNLNPFGGGSADEVTGHGTQKPVELMRRPILNHTERGAVVYDPFLGSGTTLIAAEDTGRICYGLELQVAYVDVIVLRWQNLTGKAAVLEVDGRTFDQVRAERLPESETEVYIDAAA